VLIKQSAPLAMRSYHKSFSIIFPVFSEVLLTGGFTGETGFDVL
jgi:hypothetical protein